MASETRFYEPPAARRRKALLGAGIGAYLFLRYLPAALSMVSEPAAEFERVLGLVACSVGLYGIVRAAYSLSAAPKPVLTISSEGIRGRRLFGGRYEIDGDDIDRIAGGGDNLRVRLTDGRFESLSIGSLSKEDRVAVVETAQRLAESQWRGRDEDTVPERAS